MECKAKQACLANKQNNKYGREGECLPFANHYGSSVCRQCCKGECEVTVMKLGVESYTTEETKWDWNRPNIFEPIDNSY
jgi:hypothetical protein